MRSLGGWVLGVVCLTAAALGCGDDSSPVGPGGHANAGGTGGGGNGGGGAGGTPLVPPGEPVPLPVAQWLVASTNASSDPVPAAIDDGSFILPPVGEYLGLEWAAVVPGENGALTDANADLIYAAAEIEVPAGHHAFARGDTVATFYTDNQRRHPGDFYHTRTLRVPLGAGAGKHLVVVRALGRRNTPEVELWSSDAEVVVNDADVTSPTLLAGSEDEQPLGVAVLNLGDEAIGAVHAAVADNDYFAGTVTEYASLAADATTQLSFLLLPKAGALAEAGTVPVTLSVTADTLSWSYEHDLEVEVRSPGARYRHTRRSAVDGSTQYYAVMPPKQVTEDDHYGLILSLHGAGVEASGQAEAYSPKDWAYLVAPTNRRPFGFDWEEWGRLDALEALDDAMTTLPIDEKRTHLTGHSMGGHGSWHLGVHFGQRFGMVAPSAGWISFEEYGGPAHPTGPIGRARAASQTLDYVTNLAPRSVYIIHGSSDTNVPVSHAEKMYKILEPIVPDLEYHKEIGADHWWDADPNEEGADCVDFEPMIAKMATSERDPMPLAFDFVTASPWVSARYGFVTLESEVSPMLPVKLAASVAGDTVALTTDNVRSLRLDGAALAKKGIKSVTVDGQPYPVEGEQIAIGPTDGKTLARHGPLNQVFHRPWCFVYDEGVPAYRAYAAWLTSWWALVGNGHACGVPRGGLTSDIATANNLVFLGVLPADLPDGAALPIDWSAESIEVGSKSIANAALAFVYPDGDKLAAYVFATSGAEAQLFRYTPFSSRAGMPDFVVWSASGVAATGFFDGDWKIEPSYATGL